jgi:hypothetical protein
MTFAALIPAVAVRHRATSPQPPHGIFPSRYGPPDTRTIRSHRPRFSDAPVALPEGPRCRPAASPLPATMGWQGKNSSSFLGDSQ